MSDRDDRLRPVYGIALPPRPVPSSDITIALVVPLLGQIAWVAATLLLQGIAVLAAVLLVGNGQTRLAFGLFAALLLIESLIAVFDLVVSVLAAIRTRSGGGFRYPLKLELVK